MSKADTIERFLRGAVGCGYVWGATGWTATEARIQQQAKKYPSNVNVDIVSRWIGKPCYDCAQLIKQAAKLAGYSLPSGATSQWKWNGWAQKGEIGSAPSVKLICLFRDAEGVKQHVGWRLRNGDVIDARGSAYGVVCNMRYTGWTHWAMLPGLDDGEDETPVEGKFKAIVATERDPLSIRVSASTSAEKVGKAPKGAEVEVYEDDGDWWKVGYGGVIGYAASWYLDRINFKPEEEHIAEVGKMVTVLVNDAGERMEIEGVWRVASD